METLIPNCLVNTIANINNLDKNYVASLFMHLPIIRINNEIGLPFKQALGVMRENGISFDDIWVRKIEDKLWHASLKEEEGFNLLEEVLQEIDDDDYIGFGEGSYSRYHYADMVIGVFPKKIIKKGSSYVLRDYEDRLSEADESDLNLKKINKAIELWEKESVKEENIIEYFKEIVTIVEIDLPLPFLLFGKDEKGQTYWQVTRVGMDREIIYIPKMFLDRLSIDSIDDMKKLAHIFNHDTIEIMEYTKILQEKSVVTSEDIENIHNEYGLKADLFGIREKINNYFENNVDISIKLLEKAEDKLKNDIENKQKELDSWFATNHRRKIHNVLFVLKLRLASLKDMQRKNNIHNKETIKAYNEAIDELKKVEYNDYGLLPIYVQIRIIYLYAKLVEINKLIKAMRDLVSINLGRRISDKERDLHQEYLKTNFSGIKKKVIEILEYNKQIFLGEGDYRVYQNITRAIEKINKLEVIPYSEGIETKLSKEIVVFGINGASLVECGLRFSQAFYNISFVDDNEKWVELLRHNRTYKICKFIMPNLYVEEFIKDVNAFSLLNKKDSDDIIKKIINSDLVFVAMDTNYERIGWFIAKAIEERVNKKLGVLTVIVCSNQRGQDIRLLDEIKRNILLEYHDRLSKKLNIVEAILDKIAFIPEGQHDKLTVIAENFEHDLVINSTKYRKAIMNKLKNVGGISFLSNFDFIRYLK
ncbi:MAG: hypothetical protein NC816_05845, partial [Candidatus Omnitrophica bacterium]|nr:hypothetical protein [Candidatus Omnitrophota bacterium]